MKQAYIYIYSNGNVKVTHELLYKLDNLENCLYYIWVENFPNAFPILSIHDNNIFIHSLLKRNPQS